MIGLVNKAIVAAVGAVTDTKCNFSRTGSICSTAVARSRRAHWRCVGRPWNGRLWHCRFESRRRGRGLMIYGRRFPLKAGAIAEADALRVDLLQDGWMVPVSSRLAE